MLNEVSEMLLRFTAVFWPHTLAEIDHLFLRLIQDGLLSVTVQYTMYMQPKSAKVQIMKKVDGEHSGRVLVWRSRGCGFKRHLQHCVVSLSKTH